MAKHKTIPFVKRVMAKGREYLYFDTGQKDAKGNPIHAKLPPRSDPGFGAAYAAMVGHRSRRQNVVAEMTVSRLVTLYLDSDVFAKLSVATQRVYRMYLRTFVDQLGPGPAAEIEHQDIVRLLDTMADRPGAANMVLASIRAAYKWGRGRVRHVTNDPCKDIDANELGEHDPWPDEALDAALEATDDRVRLGTHLLYYTAQRISDVMRMRWSDIDGAHIHVVQQKTDRVLAIKIHKDLAAELAKHSRSLTTIIAGASPGQPLTDNTLRTAIQSFCRKRGWKVVPHGLRKNAVNTLLESGCSVPEAAAISGQSMAMVEHYAKKRRQRPLGDAAVLKWEARGRRSKT